MERNMEILLHRDKLGKIQRFIYGMLKQEKHFQFYLANINEVILNKNSCFLRNKIFYLGVCSLSFSTSGKLLLSVGVDAPYTIAVWRWEEGINVACTTGSEDRIFRALFRPNSDTSFVSAGVKHLKFWSVAGNTLVATKAVVTKTSDGRRSSKMQTMLSIAFGPVMKNHFLFI
jgi:WD40 repeat protein